MSEFYFDKQTAKKMSTTHASFINMLKENSIYTKNNAVEIQEISKYLKSGDLVIFYGEGAISSVFKLLTGSSATHIGVVFRNTSDVCDQLSDDHLYMAETYTGDDGVIDVFTGKQGVNCRLVDFHQRLQHYPANKIVVRQLLCFDSKERQRVHRDLFRVIMYAREHIQYDLNPLHYLDAVERNLFDTHLNANSHSLGHHKILALAGKREKTLASDDIPHDADDTKQYRYCSAFVVYVYRRVGVFKKVPESGGLHDRDFFPKHFTIDFSMEDLPLEQHFSLAPFQPIVLGVGKNIDIVYL